MNASLRLARSAVTGRNSRSAPVCCFSAIEEHSSGRRMSNKAKDQAAGRSAREIAAAPLELGLVIAEHGRSSTSSASTASHKHADDVHCSVSHRSSQLWCSHFLSSTHYSLLSHTHYYSSTALYFVFLSLTHAQRIQFLCPASNSPTGSLSFWDARYFRNPSLASPTFQPLLA
ncbi:hypothetical protein BCV70DRAFT_95175 [Testicularia cyperi]|uniref:Uncharacterized protein n=1 Tax=Testicularia cyperi TaxID=1882483 RepID=A0A317XQN9_9BASI|nr:hypothetical protein BCV70DRAFT_95175 [Testicularia cyperi]